MREGFTQKADLLWLPKPVVALIVASMKQQHDRHDLLVVLFVRPVDKRLHSMQSEVLHGYRLAIAQSKHHDTTQCKRTHCRTHQFRSCTQCGTCGTKEVLYLPTVGIRFSDHHKGKSKRNDCVAESIAH